MTKPIAPLIVRCIFDDGKSKLMAINVPINFPMFLAEWESASIDEKADFAAGEIRAHIEAYFIEAAK